MQIPDAREVENRLVSLLDFERFELIKELLRNRLRVVWCMRLARAQVGGWGRLLEWVGRDGGVGAVWVCVRVGLGGLQWADQGPDSGRCSAHAWRGGHTRASREGSRVSKGCARAALVAGMGGGGSASWHNGSRRC